MDDHQRTSVSRTGDERRTLSDFLQYQRDTLAMKCTGLTAEQLKARPTPPSQLSLLGIVRHLADGERTWFQVAVAGEQAPSLWSGADGDAGVWDVESGFDVESADVDEAFKAWESACARSREIVAAAESMDVQGRYESGEVVPLRWILTHMIEEYARHNGHADLIREQIDGVTGE
ncbi:DinB family protein [Yinghuangia seranimata]|uniref:DinB family protein n=1 Tax=Yinghuangia seranimata TaxID=408067 RepID=UPI00248D3A65|nr:DinB family protein [Yinghuangia seranimata]MDI2132935.1 DinB family protein [Yinghuangia seranimata]